MVATYFYETLGIANLKKIQHNNTIVKLYLMLQ